MNADGWNELTLTYNNAPGLTFAGLGSQEVDPRLSFGSAALDMFLTADTDGFVTLIVADMGTQNATNFSFRDGDWSPEGQPSLTFELAEELAPVPEPGSMILTGFGLAALAWLRRRSARR